MKGVKFVNSTASDPTEHVPVKVERVGNCGLSLFVDGYYVITLNDDGTMKRHMNVSTKYIKVGAEGRIVIEEEA